MSCDETEFWNLTHHRAAYFGFLVGLSVVFVVGRRWRITMSGIQLPIALLPGQGYTLTVESVGWDSGRGAGGGRRGGGGRGNGGGRRGWGRRQGWGGRQGRRGRGNGVGIEKRNCYNCGRKGHLASKCTFPNKVRVPGSSGGGAPAVGSSNSTHCSVDSSTSVSSVAEQFKAMVMATSVPSPESVAAIRSAYEDELLQDEDDDEMEFVFCA
ncbi:glycine-rich protein 2-like [Folsomia candida]|uniref:CCHC-type domain-containing protein n=1 Tax=Folsomia candida TaxID=158441 RepID=A0A226EPX5_FOLCA|nr:glycine-rich protein 2-like [Folsomia candida]OXA58636.1 hypothetical protein Fcan01_07709 [Folsomia candida]